MAVVRNRLVDNGHRQAWQNAHGVPVDEPPVTCSDENEFSYAVFRLTDLTKVGGGVPTHWAPEYIFAQAYGAQGYTPVHIAVLARDIRGDAALRQTFERYYAVEACGSPIKTDN